MSDKKYCYPPNYRVLINKLDLRDAKELNYFEREFVVQRVMQGVPTGGFDLTHLKAIHHHLFQDVYEWAGEVRDIEISKGESQFQFCQYIEIGMADIHRRLVSHRFLKGLSKSEFASVAGEIMGDLNYVHPFREGNGRTQMQFLKQLVQQAGHEIDLKRIDEKSWMDASRKAHLGEYSPMAECIHNAIDTTRERKRTRKRSR